MTETRSGFAGAVLAGVIVLLLPLDLLAEEAPGAAAPRDGSAAPSTSPAPRGVEEIVVTGRKREELIQETPISMVAFSDADLETKAITRVDEIGQSVAGLKFDTTVGSSNNARIFIRGVGQASASDELDPGVGLYIDGVYLPRATGSVLRLADIERVEVLRGPQGTLFGKNTVGGVINVITRKPGEEFGGRAQIRKGNLDLTETQLSVNVPLMSERAFSRLSFTTATDDGFVRNGLTGEKAGDTKFLGGRGSLRLLPTDTVEANVSFERSHEAKKSPLGECRRVVNVALSTFVIDNTAFFREACDESSATDEFTSFSNDLFKTRLDVEALTGVLSWELGAFQLKETSSWRQVLNRGRGGDVDTTRVNFLGATPGKDKDVTVSHELLLQGRMLDDKLYLTTGLYTLREQGRSRGEGLIQRDVIANPNVPLVGDFSGPEDAPIVALFGPAPTLQQVSDAVEATMSPNALTVVETLRNVNRRTIEKFTTYSYAAFGEATYDFTDKLSLTGGLRFTEERKVRGRKFIAVFGPAINKQTLQPKPNSGDSESSGNARFSEWTGRLTASYKLTPDVLLFGGYSRGFRSGGFDDAQATDAAAGSITPFDTEKLDSYELGVKSAWFENRLVVNLTGFYNNYDDIQLSVGSLGSNGLPTVNILNAGSAVVQGLELEVQARPSWLPNLGLRGGLSLINADYKEFREDAVQDFRTDQCSSLRASECPLGRLTSLVAQLQDVEARTLKDLDVSDRDFAQVPAFSYNIEATYDFDLGRLGQLRPSVQWYHQGQNFQDVRNSKTAEQPKFGLLNSRVAWELPDGKTSVALFGRNLLDRRYIVGALDLRGSTGTNQVFYGRPRTFGVEITREF